MKIYPLRQFIYMNKNSIIIHTRRMRDFYADVHSRNKVMFSI